MNERALSAPGKLFLSGEYAVLWGGTARIAAIGPRTRALVRGREDKEVHLHTSEGRRVGERTPLGVRWREELPKAFHFAARGIDDALRACRQDGLGFSVALSASPVAANGQKLGMGGSARATVLAIEAVRSVLDARFDTLKLALVSHAASQNGKGSGADVAAIFAGGLVRYRRYPIEAVATDPLTGAAALERAPAVDLLRVPLQRIALTYAFTGESASTPQLIGKAEQRLDAEQRAAFTAQSDSLGDALEDGLARGDFARTREAVVALRSLLQTLGPLETAGTQRILSLAELYGAAGKISGAGGGDGVILFSEGAQAQKALIEGLEARGFLALPLSLEPGVRGEGAADPELSRWISAE